MISIEDPRTPPEDVPQQRECSWCGRSFYPNHAEQFQCDYECGLAEGGRLQ